MKSWLAPKAKSGIRFDVMGHGYRERAEGTFRCRLRLGFESGDSNLYRYVKNRVVNELDPAGLAPLEQNQWPSWLRAMVGQNGATGGRGVIRTITDVNQDFSHAPGADGGTVPEHFDVRYVDENGQPRRQRFLRQARADGSRAFTDEDHAAMNQNRGTDQARVRARREEAQRRRRNNVVVVPGRPPARSTTVQNAGALSLPIVPALILILDSGNGDPIVGYNNLMAVEYARAANLTVSSATALVNEYGVGGIRGLIYDLGRVNRGPLSQTPSMVIRQQIQYGLNPDISEAINNFFGLPNFREVTVQSPPDLVSPTFSSLNIDSTVMDRLLRLNLDWHDIRMSIMTRRNGSTDQQRSRALAGLGLVEERLRRDMYQRDTDTGGAGGGGEW